MCRRGLDARTPRIELNGVTLRCARVTDLADVQSIRPADQEKGAFEQRHEDAKDQKVDIDPEEQLCARHANDPGRQDRRAERPARR